MACPEPASDGQAIAGSLTELLKEPDGNYHERPGGALLADLEAGSQFSAGRDRTLRRGRALPGDALPQRRGLVKRRNRRCACTCWRPTPRCATPGLSSSGRRRDCGGLRSARGKRAFSGRGRPRAGSALCGGPSSAPAEMDILKDDAVLAGIYRSARRF